MKPDDIGRVQESLLVVAQFIDREIATLTAGELDELSFAALAIGFGTARGRTEVESDQAHEDLLEYFALEASFQVGIEIAYTTRPRKLSPPRVRRHTRYRTRRRAR